MAKYVPPGKAAASRLKPVSVDPLESVGFVSKGDKQLLDHQAQVEYFQKIVDRYMEFCDRHNKDLDAAFDSLPTSASDDATKNPPASLPPARSGAPTKGSAAKSSPPPAIELSRILLSLRKLREAILATASTIPVPFSQRVHVFSIRLSIMAQHPPSYFPSLRYLLDKLHTPTHPLEPSELSEFTSYLALDYACRQADMGAAYELRSRARARYGFRSDLVDRVLSALMHDDWVAFWRARKGLDGYMRRVTNWAVDRVRRHALKAVGSAYMNVDLNWIVVGCTGDGEGWTWEKLVEKEKLGWEKEGNKIIIKRPKSRRLEPIKEV
ncbi:hypothetical protein DTO027B5_6803 [Paecilomyces variotii]|nr:hypothetical protein DTO032I3_8623 [Paecilomyces variotii]KAJ9277956.1 hypothetical protein DTO021D3_5280 [Paecilomyces variotii]KAJ9321595.1 hypothetical protein DTO027B3_7365 [Paecilomyces variotii]KAJ9331456.1 hypothetical protein DTO027B5_6803 [Paecilomyces variotii]KAJ9346529.1 hypothetical protein DTO027B6_783 [Paecilomyces variotii]